MDTEKVRKQVSYSLTAPAVPLTVILIYVRGKKGDDLNPVDVVSETMPVLALRACDATQYPDLDGHVDPIVLSDGWPVAADKARSRALEYDGYELKRRRVCLTANVEQERADLEADKKLELLDQDAWIITQTPRKWTR